MQPKQRETCATKTFAGYLSDIDSSCLKRTTLTSFTNSRAEAGQKPISPQIALGSYKEEEMNKKEKCTHQNDICKNPFTTTFQVSQSYIL